MPPYKDVDPCLYCGKPAERVYVYGGVCHEHVKHDNDLHPYHSWSEGKNANT